MATALTNNYMAALTAAGFFHEGQIYKTSGAPFYAHPLAVSSLVLEDGGSEAEGIAALFHDAPEDAGGAETLDIIRGNFGDEVADLVIECSEPYERPRAPWKHRKDVYIANIATASDGAVRIMTADKLHNAGRLPIEFERVGGPDLWNKFVVSRDETIWFYETTFNALRERRGNDDPMIVELERAVSRLSTLAY